MTDKEIKDNIRQRLIECRREQGLTQSEVGDIVGKSKNAIASWEQGLSMPDVAQLMRLTAYYHKTLEYMYGVDANDDTEKK